LLRDAARLDRTQSDPIVSLRNAVGVGIPLVIGTLAGGPALGLATTIGALQTAFADRPGPYRLRMLRMLGTALAAAVTSGLAIVASRNEAASVALLFVLAFVAGLLLAGGPAAAQVGVAGVAAALILGHISRPDAAALHVALLVFAGGALQTLLAIAAWPLRRHAPERQALSRLYRELAAAARAQHGSEAPPPATDTLTMVRQTMYGLGHDHGPSVEAYRVLLDEAERIRREIVVLTAAGERLRDEGEPGSAQQVGDSLVAAAVLLDEVADALSEGRPVRAQVLEQVRTTLRSVMHRLEDTADARGELTRRAAAARLRALSGQLRAAVESSRAGATEGRARDEPGVDLVRDPLAVLRANLTPESAVFRHALRLAILVAGSDLFVRVAGVDRGYWVPLTLLVVLRPDFATTLQRSVLRVVGTVVGLVVATELVHLVPGGDWWRVLLIFLFAFGTRLTGPANFALSAVFLSGLVVVLLEVSGVPAHTTVVSRALDTLTGGALAVLAALALPAWERRFLPARLGDLVGAYRGYVTAVADPKTDHATMLRARGACRLTRSNAQASVERAESEPVRGAAEVELGRTVLAHTHRFIHAMLSVEAVRRRLREAGGLPELAEFLDAAGEVLDATQRALLRGQPPGTVPDLRPLQDRLATMLVEDPARAGGVDTATTLVDATDRITNSLDTLISELRRQLPLASAR
jgi:uncharacterized membrane protein YccC